MRRSVAIILVLLMLALSFQAQTVEKKNVEQTAVIPEIGDNETHGSYYSYSNISVAKGESMSIINENFFEYDSSINVEGNLSIRNSTISSSENVSLEIYSGNFTLKDSWIDFNGSISFINSKIYIINSKIGMENGSIPFISLNSSVYIIDSVIYGQKTAKMFNYTSETFSNNTYQTGGNVPLERVVYHKSYSKAALVSVYYNGTAGTDNPSIEFNISGYVSYHVFASRSTFGWLNFSIPLGDKFFNPDITAYFYLNDSGIVLTKLRISIISNDTYDLYGPSYFDLILNKTLFYSINSTFDIDSHPFLLPSGMHNPMSISIIAKNSTLYIDDMTSRSYIGGNFPFAASNSDIFYFRSTRINYFSDGSMVYGIKDSIDAISDSNDSFVDSANKHMIDATSTLYPWNNESGGCIPIMAWYYNGSMEYTGNYLTDNFNTDEYFSFEPFPDLKNSIHIFNASYTLPELEIHLKKSLLLYGKNNTISFSVRSFYADSGPLKLFFSITGNGIKKCIGNISYENVNSTGINGTLEFYADEYPGDYVMNVSYVSDSYILSKNPIISENVSINTEETIGINVSYFYIVPFDSLNLTLYLENAHNLLINGTLYLSFSSLNQSENTSFNVSIDPSSRLKLFFDERTDFSIRSVNVSFVFSRECMNVNDRENYSFPLLPIYRVYRVSFSRENWNIGTWGIRIGNVTYDSSSQSINISIPNGTYSFTVLNNRTFHALYNGTLDVHGKNLTVNISFDAVVYNIMIVSRILHNWTLVFDGSYYNGNTSFELQNGTYFFSVLPPLGYSANPSSFNVTVEGKNVSEEISFSRIIYTIRISATNITGKWTIDLNGTYFSSNTSKITVNVTAGSYKAVPENTSFYISDSIFVIHVPGNSTYTVYYEKRLSSLTIFARNFSGSFGLSIGNFSSSVNGSVSLDIPFGEYSVEVYSHEGYTATYPKNIEIDESRQVLYINFSPVKYNVTLYSTVPFELSANGMIFSYNFIHTFQAENGTYIFHAYSQGYWPLSGYLVVSGSSLNRSLEFLAFNYTVVVRANASPLIIRIDNKTVHSEGNILYLSLKNGSYTIMVSSPGYVSKTVHFNVSGSGLYINVAMHRESILFILYSFILLHLYEILFTAIISTFVYYRFIRNTVIINGKNEDNT